MAFIRKLKRNIPLHSGCDDEDPSGELQVGLEDLQEMYSVATNNAAMANTSLALEREGEHPSKGFNGYLVCQAAPRFERRKEEDVPDCVLPMPASNGVMAFNNKAMAKGMEAQSHHLKGCYRNEKLDLKAKQLQMEQVEQERAFKLQEQQMPTCFDFFSDSCYQRKTINNYIVVSMKNSQSTC